MRYWMLVLPLAFAACGPAPDQPTPGSELREKINKETLAYNNCVMDAGKKVAIMGRMATMVADDTFKACHNDRQTLLGDVLAFRRAGHPSEPEANSKATAEQSVLNLEADIRDRLLVAITQRKLAEEIGNNASN